MIRNTIKIRSKSKIRSGYCAVLAMAAVVCAGCGGGSGPARYVVTGKVTFQGQGVEEGEVTFADPAAGQVNSSVLGSGGSYSMELPAGNFRVSVAPPLVEKPGGPDSPPDMVPKAVKNIPKRYWVQETSGLTAEVSKEKKAFDFELKP